MTTALEWGEGSASRPGRSLPRGKIRLPFYRRLGGPQGRSGHVRNISPPPTGTRSQDRPGRSSVAIPTELPGPLNAHRPTYLPTEMTLHNLNKYKIILKQIMPFTFISSRIFHANAMSQDVKKFQEIYI